MERQSLKSPPRRQATCGSRSRNSFDLAGLGRYLRLGIPVGLQLSLEANAFTVAMIMIGWIGVTMFGPAGVTMIGPGWS